MRELQRRLLLVSLGLLLAAGGIFALTLRTPTPLKASAKQALDFPGTWYGGQHIPDAGGHSRQLAAVTVWQQRHKCMRSRKLRFGLFNYDSLLAGQGIQQGANAVTAIMVNNNFNGASQWGYPPNPPYQGNLWGGITNIAPDYGTDPRSVAYMSWNYSINNRWFHDYVYRASFVGNNPDYPTQVEEATTRVASALEDWYGDPVIAFINQGLHAVLISGIWSTNDPDGNFPASITGLVVRYPEGDVNTSRYEVSMSQWMSGMQTPFGWYSLWSYYYGNTYDPDPVVGPYAGANHWFTGFTWVQRDGFYADGMYSPDWAFNAVSYAKMTTP